MDFLSTLPSTSTLADDLMIYSTGSIPIAPRELNLRQTLLGGQSFRWTEQNSNEYLGVIDAYIVRLQHQNDNLRYTCFANQEKLIKSPNINDRRVESALVLHNYFQLTVRIGELFEKWSKVDLRFRKGLILTGVRVLAQEPLENLISLICSSDNNAQRTSKMIEILSNEYGKKIGTLNGTTYHQFPALDELNRPDLETRLYEFHFGFHAKYIQEVIHVLKYSLGGMLFFDQLKSLTMSEARYQLLKLLDIDRKIADCVLLMSLGKQDVVPVDAYVQSIAMTYYGNGRKLQSTAANYEKLASFFEQLWQPLPGWAQAAAFFNEHRNSTNSKLSLKRSINNSDRFIEKIFKTTDENNNYQSIKITRKREKNVVLLEPSRELPTRPKRNTKPIDRF